MGIQITERQAIRATLYEIERGLFFISYSVDGADTGTHHLPRYQVGTSAADARQRIELRARESGYEAVMWEPAPEHQAIMTSPAKEYARPTR